MPLSSSQLEAFLAVARAGSFSAAARALALTQSALSQRVLNLEGELGAQLLVRAPGSVQLTEVGRRLLQYGLAGERLEVELLEDLKPGRRRELRGHLRIAGFSSIMRSAVLPALEPLLKASPDVTVELQVAELRELPRLLLHGLADLVFTYEPVSAARVKSEKVGTEEYVLIAPPEGSPETILDHDPEDATTIEFFRRQKARPPRLRRSYFGDIYGIIDGVERGLGRAVVARHLIQGNRRVAIVEGYRPVRLDVYVGHFEQAVYTRLQASVLETIRGKFRI
ncbi:MAG TPA: LysR family transcriptional regulator [Bdellovibrionota bacterium]|nr:LysR family transcriptional regulator [Bdellovibrionota bacterium]